ncbi:MAG TPA: hypothetical protein PLD73_06460 [Candidatus Hydrogenedentes bacterium]|nr:hypothetical protein [Candidatus Hydrogenedentota bacterium]
MDAEKRIQELESQVLRLTRELQQFRETRKPPGTDSEAPHPAPSHSPSPETSSFTAPVATRAWPAWVSRLAVVFVTVAIILAAGKSASTSAFDLRSKALAAYSMAALLLLLGAAFPDRRSLLASLALGTGLAAAYFMTYAAFFITNARLFAEPWYALPVLFAAILGMTATVAWRRSYAAAVIAWPVVYYSFGLTASDASTMPQLTYALSGVALASAGAVLLHIRFHWRFLVWLVLLGSYGTILPFLYSQPQGILLTPEAYFWISRGALAFVFVVLGLATVLDVRRPDQRSRGMLLLSLLNSAVFFPAVWTGIHAFHAPHAWVFRLAFTVVLATLALLAETRGSRKNYLFQAYIAQAFVMAILAMISLYPGITLWPALALVCFALAVFYQHSGAIILKAGSILLLFVVAVGAFFTVQAPGYAVWGQHAIPARWLGCAGPAIVFFFIALYYERATRSWPMQERRRSGQWFLADTFLDPPGPSVAMLYAAAGALLLMTLTIAERAQQPDLPYLLGTFSLALAIVGVLASTPQLEAAAVLLLMAAHVSFHFFLLVDKSGFEQDGGYAYGTILLALYTYLAGILWERYLKRVGDDRAWEHNLVAPLPHVGATYMIATLMAYKHGAIYIPATYNAIGTVLLIFLLFLPLPGLKIAGIALFGIGAAYFSNLLFDPAAAQPGGAAFLYYLVPFLMAYAVSERLIFFAHKRPAVTHPMDDTLRTLLVAAGAGLGLLALNKWASEEKLALYWLIHGLAGIGLSVLFREARYRWAASLVLVLAVLQMAFSFSRGGGWLYPFAILAWLAVAAVLALAIHQRRRRRAFSPQSTAEPRGPSPDE